MISKSRKAVYLGIFGTLTATAMTAAYWQTSRYFQSKEKWRKISQQLKKENPDDISQLSSEELYPMRYIKADGKMLDKYLLVDRVREGEVGSLVVRPLEYSVLDGDKVQKKYIIAVVGWIPQYHEYNPKEETKAFSGILREKQRTDYLHRKMKESDIQKFNINTYIDLQKCALKLGIDPASINPEFYIETLRNINEQITEDNFYPLQYRIDNFQLPYLTPDRHQGYATFWSLTSFVGLTAIIKTLRIK